MDEVTLQDLETLKTQWAELNQRLNRLEDSIEAEGRRVVDSNIKSAKETLVKKYRKFFIIGIGMSIATPLIFMKMLPDLGVEGWQKIVSMGLFWVYFITAALEDAYLMNKAKGIDLLKWPIHKVAREARQLRHKHHIFMGSMIILAVITIGFFVYNIVHDTAVLIGVACGGAMGLAIGLKEYFQIMHAYRELMDNSEDSYM